MPRAKNHPKKSLADDPDFGLDRLLSQFKGEFPEKFAKTPGLLVDDLIPYSCRGWQLATHPACWSWLAEKCSGERQATLIIAHWLIGQRDYQAGAQFLDWVKASIFTDTPYEDAVSCMGAWLQGDQAKAIAKSDPENMPKRPPDADSLRMWNLVQQMAPEWVSGGRMEHGLVNKIARALKLHDMSDGAVYKRLLRMKKKYGK